MINSTVNIKQQENIINFVSTLYKSKKDITKNIISAMQLKKEDKIILILSTNDILDRYKDINILSQYVYDYFDLNLLNRVKTVHLLENILLIAFDF